MSVDTLNRLLSLAGHGLRLIPVFQRWRRGVMLTSFSDLVSASFPSFEPCDSGDGGWVLGTEICGRKNDWSVMSVSGDDVLPRGIVIDIATPLEMGWIRMIDSCARVVARLMMMSVCGRGGCLWRMTKADLRWAENVWREKKREEEEGVDELET